MILKPKTAEQYTDLHGGRGNVTISKHLGAHDVNGLDLFAKVVVEKGGSIGYHEHLEDSEGYYILSGAADFIDADGTHKPIVPGDLCLITKGQSHGIVNTGEGALEFLAVVF